MAELSGGKSSTTLPNPSGVMASLRTEIKQMEQRFEELREAQARARRQTMLTIVVLILVMLGFFLAGFFKLRENFRQEEIQRALIAPSIQVRRAATAQAINTFRKVGPVYQKLLIERAQKVGPEIADKAVAEFKQLPDELGRDMLNALGQSFQKVSQRSEAELKVSFPELAGDGAQKTLEQLEAKVGEQSELIKKQITDKMHAETMRLQDLLVKLDEAPEAKNPKTPTWELERQFLHTLVQMVDYHIMRDDDKIGGK